MAPNRRTALVAGLLFLVTHVTSIAALVLYDPVLNDTGYITGAGADGRIALGAWLEGILAMAVAGTAVTLYPVVKRQQRSMALGYVALRTLEGSMILLGLVALLAVVTLRRDGVGDVAVGQALVAVHDWSFLVGPAFVLGVNTFLLAYLMFRSGLVPRYIGALGMFGGPLVAVSATLTLFDVYGQVSAWGLVLAVPVFAWELNLAFWMVIKGFRPAAAILQPNQAIA